MSIKSTLVRGAAFVVIVSGTVLGGGAVAQAAPAQQVEIIAAPSSSLEGYAECVGIAPATSAWAVLRQRINPLTYFNYFWCAGLGSQFQQPGQVVA